MLEEDRADGVVRQLVRYEAEPGLPVEGYLLRPDGPGPPDRPGVVVLHSTVDYTIRQPAGLEGPADKHIGLHLARRGYVAFCPRCFLWQYGRPERLIARPSTGSHAAIPASRAWPRCSSTRSAPSTSWRASPTSTRDRLGAIGHSLGAKEVLYLAAFDPRIRATVSSEGGIGLTYSNWDAPWYLGDAIRRPGFAARPRPGPRPRPPPGPSS